MSPTVQALREAGVTCISCFLLAAQASKAEESAPGSGVGHSAVGPIEEVLVTGEHPGPGLWKVTRGTHVLWILGVRSPLPKDLVWRSKEAEAAIAGSEEVLGAYSVSLRVDRADAFRSPRPLKDVLSRRDYARWSAMRDKYIGTTSRETEFLLPPAAALLLQASAYERTGLTYADDVWRTIFRVAHEHRVPVQTLGYVLDPDVLGLGKTRRSSKNRTGYLVQTMDRLEMDVSEQRARANAWAVGDVEVLRALADSDASYAMSLAYGWPFLTDEDVRKLQAHAENKLLASLERALNRNRATFAALPVSLLLRRDGLLARLRATGYTVSDPQ
jgi:hypothetical protein